MKASSAPVNNSGSSDVRGKQPDLSVNNGEIWRQIVPFSLIFLLACCVFFLDLGKLPLFNPDEGLFAEPAREILDTGEWVTSLLNYVVRYTKPPLAMWAMALSFQVFGVNEFAARFFGAVCASLIVAITYCFLARYSGTRSALIGSSTLLMAPLFVATARMAITDLPLSLFFVSSLVCFFRAFVEQDGRLRWLGYGLVGLAVMTKGPVALVLPAAILFVYHLLKGELRAAWMFYKPLKGALLVGVIALPWFAAEIAITKGAYFQSFILRENFQRFSSVVDSHKGGWWYHLAAMAAGYFPWSAFLPQSVHSAFFPSVPSRPDAKTGLSAWITGFRNLSVEQSALLFAAVWALVTLVFFSASVSKLLTYTLPAFPALAILVGIELSKALQSKSVVRLTVPFALLAIIYGAAGLLVPALIGRLRDCPPELVRLATNLISMQCVIAILTLLLALLRRPGLAVLTFSLLTLAASASLGRQAAQSVSQRWEGALPDFARYAACSGDQIFLFDLRKPGAVFYTRRQVIQPGSKAALEARLTGFERAYILTKAVDRSYFQSLSGCRIVAQDGYALLVSWRRPPGVLSANDRSNPEPASDLSLAN
jgi:4-amino-4-deoxy-L-arabinose transferase-like glycosyltransferase